MRRVDNRAAAVATFLVGVLQVGVLESRLGLTPYIALLATLLGVACMFAAVALWCRGCLESRGAAGALGTLTGAGVLLQQLVGLPGLDAGTWGLAPFTLLTASATAATLALLASPASRPVDPYASWGGAPTAGSRGRGHHRDPASADAGA
ncbi:MAG TPA: hypothetical protein VFK52_12825 [Nocardioidaceae bacterium]|nr:hypothetical protein [Nocardioidaceae bacterium]